MEEKMIEITVCDASVNPPRYYKEWVKKEEPITEEQVITQDEINIDLDYRISMLELGI